MIEVFKTNVNKEEEARQIIETLSYKYPDLIANFDLEDCDKILRVCGSDFTIDDIAGQLHTIGYKCDVLEI